MFADPNVLFSTLDDYYCSKSVSEIGEFDDGYDALDACELNTNCMLVSHLEDAGGLDKFVTQTGCAIWRAQRNTYTYRKTGKFAHDRPHELEHKNKREPCRVCNDTDTGISLPTLIPIRGIADTEKI